MRQWTETPSHTRRPLARRITMFRFLMIALFLACAAAFARMGDAALCPDIIKALAASSDDDAGRAELLKAARGCVEADAAVCAALAQRQAALVEALGRDERDASDLVAKHCVDDPSVGDLADDPTSSPRAQFDLDLSGDTPRVVGLS